MRKTYYCGLFMGRVWESGMSNWTISYCYIVAHRHSIAPATISDGSLNYHASKSFLKCITWIILKINWQTLLSSSALSDHWFLAVSNVVIFERIPSLTFTYSVEFRRSLAQLRRNLFLGGPGDAAEHQLNQEKDAVFQAARCIIFRAAVCGLFCTARRFTWETPVQVQCGCVSSAFSNLGTKAPSEVTSH